MMVRTRLCSFVAAVALVAGCANTDTASQDGAAAESGGDTSPSAEDTATPETAAADTTTDSASGDTTSTAEAGDDPLPNFEAETFEPTALPDIEPTDTAVGQRVARYLEELGGLEESVAERQAALRAMRERARELAVAYNDLIGQITARLQTGTTPGNPELVDQWREAQGILDELGQQISEMTNLANAISGDAGTAAYLLDSVRAAYGLSGAVETDHDHLQQLEDQVRQTVVRIERLSNQVNQDVDRQQRYLASERNNLRTLSLSISRGELIGGGSGFGLASGRLEEASLPDRAGTARFGEPQTGQRVTEEPLVVIEFDQPQVNFERPLFEAVNEALNRRPEARFELVAVAPDTETVGEGRLASTRARDRAEEVYRALTRMGMPADRLSLTETRSAQAQANEVHIYVQ